MSAEAPQRRRLPLPVVTEWPRVGKIRLGEKINTGKTSERTGESISRPSAIDYFRVDAEDGVTSPEAAASFHEVYGQEPRSIRCQLPGRAPEDVFEGAWRLYGARKLKQVCDGETCDVRTATGGWESGPCACKAQGIPLKRSNGAANPDHCKLTWTLNVILPDVVGVGVWQIDTGSEISIARVSRWLQMMAAVAGDLMLLDFTLNLVPVDVTPDGRTKRVFVLEPRAVSSSPRELIGGGGRPDLPQLEAGAPRPALPPAADDDVPLTEGEVVLPTWEETLDQLRALAPDLSDAEIGAECSRVMGRTVKATELGHPDVSGRVIAAFLDRAEEQGGGAGVPADPGPDEPPLFEAAAAGAEPPYGEPE